MLSDEEKARITKKLKRTNRKIFTDNAILHIINHLEKVRDGTVKLTDWFIPNHATYEDFVFQLNLSKFIPNDS